MELIVNEESEPTLKAQPHAAASKAGWDTVAHLFQMLATDWNLASREAAFPFQRERGHLFTRRLRHHEHVRAGAPGRAEVSQLLKTRLLSLGETPDIVNGADTSGLQAQLAQAQKMGAVGTLATGVAHDLNNLLMVISGCSELALVQTVDDDAQQLIRCILDAAGRAAALTGQLMAFSRKQSIQPRVLNLNEVVRGMEKMMARLVRENITVETILDGHLCLCKADPMQMQQVLMNLVVNARDAMPDGGRLRIETGNVTFDSASSGHLKPAQGSFVTLAISDTGIGIDRETQQHIFEPFFTTKELGRGTGIGLSTVYEIVKQSGGYLLVDSEVGCGARFTVYLPIVQGMVGVADDSATGGRVRAPMRCPGATILLVDDEQRLLDAGTKFLGSFGYNVIAASDAYEAIDHAEKFPGKIDLLVTDLVMPGLNGTALAQHVRRLRPNIKLLFMSGYADVESLTDPLLDSGHILEKPFSFRGLANKLEELLRSA